MKLGWGNQHCMPNISKVILRSPEVMWGQIIKDCQIFMKLGGGNLHCMPNIFKVMSRSYWGHRGQIIKDCRIFKKLGGNQHCMPNIFKVMSRSYWSHHRSYVKLGGGNLHCIPNIFKVILRSPEVKLSKIVGFSWNSVGVINIACWIFSRSCQGHIEVTRCQMRSNY